MKTKFAERFCGKGNAKFLSQQLSNKHKILEKLDFATMYQIINRCELSKINCYSTMIPRFFDRVV